MKKLSEKIAEVEQLIKDAGIQSVSFDIDGTLYAMDKVKKEWWKNFFLSPLRAMKFYRIKQAWEKKRNGSDKFAPLEADVDYFENYLLTLLNPEFVPAIVRTWISELKSRGIKILFITDHGARQKLDVLKLNDIGARVNCLRETGNLKPHPDITSLLIQTYQITPLTHLHLGDRWTDEEQARLLGCTYRYFAP